MTRNVGLLAAIVLLAGCDGESTPTQTAGLEPLTAAASAAASAEHQDLATLRRATARYHRIEAAHEDGWDTQFPPGCFAIDTAAMGFHFINGSNVGTLDPARPQLLLYEPQADGSMKLVGVEFIYPGVPSDTPPVLFGQTFHYNYTFSVWALHVWAWRDNPEGLYADYNPRVSCEYAATTAGAHH